MQWFHNRNRGALALVHTAHQHTQWAHLMRFNKKHFYPALNKCIWMPTNTELMQNMKYSTAIVVNCFPSDSCIISVLYLIWAHSSWSWIQYDCLKIQWRLSLELKMIEIWPSAVAWFFSISKGAMEELKQPHCKGVNRCKFKHDFIATIVEYRERKNTVMKSMLLLSRQHNGHQTCAFNGMLIEYCVILIFFFVSFFLFFSRCIMNIFVSTSFPSRMQIVTHLYS